MGDGGLEEQEEEEEKEEDEEEEGVVDTHQRFIHSPVESGHRVGPNVPAKASANLSQPALAPEPSLRVTKKEMMVKVMGTVVVAPQLGCIQEVLLHAGLPGQHPFPPCSKRPSFHGTLTVDDAHVGSRPNPQRAAVVMVVVASPISK